MFLCPQSGIRNTSSLVSVSASVAKPALLLPTLCICIPPTSPISSSPLVQPLDNALGLLTTIYYCNMIAIMSPPPSKCPLLDCFHSVS